MNTEVDGWGGNMKREQRVCRIAAFQELALPKDLQNAHYEIMHNVSKYYFFKENMHYDIQN